jgi:hypothetical protein
MLSLLYLHSYRCIFCEPGSSVGIENPGEAKSSAPVQTDPGAHKVTFTMATGSLQGVESGCGVTLAPHPLLVPRTKNTVELYLCSP